MNAGMAVRSRRIPLSRRYRQVGVDVGGAPAIQPFTRVMA